MSSDIINILQLDKSVSSRVFVVKEINRCDGSFIASCVLNHCIKNKIGVFVLSTHNSLQHYQNVGLRINYNLQRHVDTGLVHFLNFGECCVNNILKNETLPDIFLHVKDKVLLLQEKHETVCVLLDGISHLFDLNYQLIEVNKFCVQLIELVTSYNNSFIVCHCNEAFEGDITSIMSNLLSHKAHTVLEVENLQSGLSADVTGHLTVKNPGYKFDKNHLYTIDIKQSRYLFKLFERGVKLFAPGTV